MSDENDADLRERFRVLRNHDDAAAPPFDATLARAATREPRKMRMGAQVAVAAGAAVAVFLLLPGPSPMPGDDLAVELPAWPRQTALLLTGTDDAWRSVAWSRSPTSKLGPTLSSHLPEVK